VRWGQWGPACVYKYTRLLSIVYMWAVYCIRVLCILFIVFCRLYTCQSYTVYKWVVYEIQFTCIQYYSTLYTIWDSGSAAWDPYETPLVLSSTLVSVVTNTCSKNFPQLKLHMKLLLLVFALCFLTFVLKIFCPQKSLIFFLDLISHIEYKMMVTGHPRRDGAGSFVLLWFSVLIVSLALWKVIDIALWVSGKISITFLQSF